ncbi:MAG: hypothetical protein RLZZ347_622 [Candidatus Parcubacteria bacterium]|jgi:hypothetical protein
MSSFSGRVVLVVVCVGVIVWGAFVLDFGHTDTLTTPALTFDACVTSSGQVSDIFPRTCTTSDGQVLTESITNETSLIDTIRITTPRPEMRIKSPLVVEGFARGTWFFEGSFPVKLLDTHGKVLATVPAYAQKEWMTSDFVPFRAELTFTQKQSGVGKLILQKDNPSGDASKDQSLTMLVHFLGKYSESSATIATTTKQ